VEGDRSSGTSAAGEAAVRGVRPPGWLGPGRGRWGPGLLGRAVRIVRIVREGLGTREGCGPVGGCGDGRGAVASCGRHSMGRVPGGRAAIRGPWPRCTPGFGRWWRSRRVFRYVRRGADSPPVRGCFPARRPAWPAGPGAGAPSGVTAPVRVPGTGGAPALRGAGPGRSGDDPDLGPGRDHCTGLLRSGDDPFLAYRARFAGEPEAVDRDRPSAPRRLRAVGPAVHGSGDAVARSFCRWGDMLRQHGPGPAEIGLHHDSHRAVSLPLPSRIASR
jgi:hypothetical protein